MARDWKYWMVVQGSDGLFGVEVVRQVTLASGSTGWLVELGAALRHPVSGEFRKSWVLGPKYADWQLDGLVAGVSVPVRVCSLVSAANVDQLGDGDLVIDFEADLALEKSDLPTEFDVAQFWVETRGRIERFIAEHGHSAVPEDYHDEIGLLGILVFNIRWYLAGKGGLSPGPFAGVDMVSELEDIDGWEWLAVE